MLVSGGPDGIPLRTRAGRPSALAAAVAHARPLPPTPGCFLVGRSRGAKGGAVPEAARAPPPRRAVVHVSGGPGYRAAWPGPAEGLGTPADRPQGLHPSPWPRLRPRPPSASSEVVREQSLRRRALGGLQWRRARPRGEQGRPRVTPLHLTCPPTGKQARTRRAAADAESVSIQPATCPILQSGAVLAFEV